jgi:hypothetical protein
MGDSSTGGRFELVPGIALCLLGCSALVFFERSTSLGITVELPSSFALRLVAVWALGLLTGDGSPEAILELALLMAPRLRFWPLEGSSRTPIVLVLVRSKRQWKSATPAGLGVPKIDVPELKLCYDS